MCNGWCVVISIMVVYMKQRICGAGIRMLQRPSLDTDFFESLSSFVNRLVSDPVNHWVHRHVYCRISRLSGQPMSVQPSTQPSDEQMVNHQGNHMVSNWASLQLNQVVNWLVNKVVNCLVTHQGNYQVSHRINQVIMYDFVIMLIAWMKCMIWRVR